MPSLGGWELVIMLGVLVLLFGAGRLPAMARSVGRSARVFQGEMKGLEADGATTEDEVTMPPVAPAPRVREPSRTGQDHSGAGQ